MNTEGCPPITGIMSAGSSDQDNPDSEIRRVSLTWVFTRGWSYSSEPGAIGSDSRNTSVRSTTHDQLATQRRLPLVVVT